MKRFLYPMIVALGLLGCQKKAQQQVDFADRDSYVNLLNIKNVPKNAKDRAQFVFADLGAWSGFALPENEGTELVGGFIGPYAMNASGWISRCLAQPQLVINGQSFDFSRNAQTAEYLPGKLVQKFRNSEIEFVTELCFFNARSALIRTQINNVSDKALTLSFSWKGGLYQNVQKIEQIDHGFSLVKERDSLQTAVLFYTADRTEITAKDSVQAIEKEHIELKANEIYQSRISISQVWKEESLNKEIDKLKNCDFNLIFQENEERWNKQLASVFSKRNEFIKDKKYRNVMAKAIMTLSGNWRGKVNDLLHDGCTPSYIGFSNGVWSWDSWKHASASCLFNPELAKNEIRALFDYQAGNGMIPDYVSYDKRYNNWRDTKPPLAAWAVKNIYEATHDISFVSEMFDRLYLYHRWWYSHRDHDKNGICEYGSTDGTLIAAAWESGMDNGVRFDDTVMLKNEVENAWSMNQESICLNSFLYAEKKYLAKLALLLKKKDVAELLLSEAEKVKEYVQTKMFDKESGFFYDRRIDTGELIKVMGAECWLPLWAEIATPKQALRVSKVMLNEKHFNSTVPLGTLDISNLKLRPISGYWRGPVWVDQVYFGITGLRNYGYDKEADFFTKKYIRNAQGLLGDSPFHENYNPLTGERLNTPHFGWAAATTLKMLLKN